MAKSKELLNKGVKIKLDKTRNIRFDFESFVEIEEVYGSAEAGIELFKTGNLKALKTFLLIGLKETDLDINNLLRSSDKVIEAKVAIFEALALFYGIAEDDEYEETDEEKK